MKPGDKLGPYEILAALGAGGMGEVYRGRDTKLDREVAVKVLPAALARDPERLARFEREAKVLASLNHPNIAQIYGVQEAEGHQALVMELVPGQTLGAQIKSGAIPLDESLRLAAQMVEALSAAHEKGITHRDFKPANVMITPDGVVKVLDFGLAAVAQPNDAPAGTNVATLTMSPTSAGMIMGTAPYMSPEQARGNQADRRSDIFSFGVVLYEMLTGRQLFHGETVSEILASVLKDDPNLGGVPEQVRPLLKRCLEKDPKKRLQAVGDWDLALAAGSGSPRPATEASASAPSRFSIIAIAGAAVFALATAAISFVHFRETPSEQANLRFQVPLLGQDAGNVYEKISPDGRYLVVRATATATEGLRIRPLNSLAVQALDGTSGADYPFWSPDSKSIGFFADGKLKRIDIAGGPALTLADAPVGRGGTWAPDGTILFSPDRASPILRIAAAGGRASPATSLGGKQGGHRLPWMLPDGRHFLYAEILQSGSDHVSLHVGDLASADVRSLGEADSAAVYAQGHLLFLREDTLMAQPFDPARLAATGEATPLEPQILRRVTTAYADFSTSTNGLLAFRKGTSVGTQQLTWVERNGKQTTTLGEPADITNFQLSPDGKRVAATVRTNSGEDIWLYDAVRGGRTRFTFGPEVAGNPVWSPEGNRLVFQSTRGEGGGLYERSSDGAGAEQLLSKGTGPQRAPSSWSGDGQLLLSAENTVFLMSLKAADGAASSQPIRFLPYTPQALVRYAQFSPDGRWVAYMSDESGRDEVYVVSFPAKAGKRQVSVGGGVVPRWRRDGKEIFYRTRDGALMVAPVLAKGDSIEIGEPKALPINVPNRIAYSYDVSVDGQRFLILPRTQSGTPEGITVVQNWQAGLKK